MKVESGIHVESTTNSMNQRPIKCSLSLDVDMKACKDQIFGSHGHPDMQKKRKGNVRRWRMRVREQITRRVKMVKAFM
jgi:hypothetical protein